MPAPQSSSSHYPGTLSSRDIRIHNVQLQCDQLWIHSIGTCLVQSGTFRFWEFCSPWKLGPSSIPSQGLDLLYFPDISMELSVHRVRAQDSTGAAVEMHTHITNSSKARPSGPQLLRSPLSIAKHRHIPRGCRLSINFKTKKMAQACELYSLKRKLQMLPVNNCFKASCVRFIFIQLISCWAKKAGGMGDSTYKKHYSTMNPHEIKNICNDLAASMYWNASYMSTGICFVHCSIFGAWNRGGWHVVSYK